VSRPFNKPATSIAQQLAHLQAEGMAITDFARAEHWLQHVSYYRLSAYWLPFERPKDTPGSRFLSGTNSTPSPHYMNSTASCGSIC
jgi:abortive infection bacteriophage resistance protein